MTDFENDQNPIVLAKRGRRWLSLREASDFLGIHYTTLRAWADRGEIRTFRTPGGHRRFDIVDLQRFLEERITQPATVDVDTMVDSAVGQARQAIAKLPSEQSTWRREVDEHTRQMTRERGRQLFALAINFVMRTGQRSTLLKDGRALGREYGAEAARNNVSLAETGRAVQFFRRQLLEAVRRDESLDPEDVHIRKLLAQFLDEVLYAVLEGYESVLAGK
jgi:excisionase family DNA binding protein